MHKTFCRTRDKINMSVLKYYYYTRVVITFRHAMGNKNNIHKRPANEIPALLRIILHYGQRVKSEIADR
jgi:hypothetical protein